MRPGRPPAMLDHVAADDRSWNHRSPADTSDWSCAGRYANYTYGHAAAGDTVADEPTYRRDDDCGDAERDGDDGWDGGYDAWDGDGGYDADREEAAAWDRDGAEYDADGENAVVWAHDVDDRVDADIEYIAVSRHGVADPGHGDDWWDAETPTVTYGSWQDSLDRAARWLATTAERVLTPALNQVEAMTTRWMDRWSIVLAQICLGVIYIWFGALKLVPGMSPAEGLVRATVAEIAGLIGIPIPAVPVFILLAAWEVTIGVGIVVERCRQLASWMLLLHLPTTLLPFVLVPEVVWTRAPLGLTLEGQYIIKNLALFGSVSAVFASRYARERRNGAGATG